MIKQFFFRAFTVCALLCGILLAVRMAYTSYYNRSLEADFMPNNWMTEYQDHRSMEDIDIDKIVRHYFSVSAGYSPTLALSIVLDKDIYYYSQPDIHSEVVYQLNAGKRYYIYGNSLCLEPRILSMPTYCKGWRYALPLITEDQYRKLNYLSLKPFWVIGEGPYLSEQYCYIQTKDLISLIRKLEKESGYFSWMDEIHWLFDDRYALGSLYGIDQSFWNDGIYISPDLYMPYWRLPEIILFLLMFFFAVGAATYYRKKRIGD